MNATSHRAQPLARSLVGAGLVAIAVGSWIWRTPPALGTQGSHGPPLESRRGAVAADDPTASAVGAAVLAEGGNAVDAAVATALAVGVLNPASSGIGGGGFALVWDAGARTTRVYDFREVAPATLDPSDFHVDGKPDPALARRGGLAVGVPGEIRGLAQMARGQGRLSWRRLVLPAAHLARDGTPTSWFLAHVSPETLADLPDEPPYTPLRDLLGGDRARRRGDLLVRPALAATLLAVAADPEAFYRGPLADDLVATARAAGGVISAEDLAAYQVVERAPLWGSWQGLRVATMPVPSSGGVILLETLGILERTGIDLPALGAGSSAAMHVIAEALKHGFADRARLMGDSESGRAAAAALLDDARLRRLAARVRLDRTQPAAVYGEMPAGPAGVGGRPGTGGTSHVCVIDVEGNAVSLTTTVNGYFGSKLVTAGGVVLNNQIDDFTIDPTLVNGFGLTQSEANLVGPGRRPLSSMTPTLLFDGDRVVGCAGGSGGPRIISNTAQVILGVWLFGLDARTAVESQRVHHQWSPDELKVEADLAPDVRGALAARGHVLGVTGSPSAVQVIRVRPDGVLEAASDPRKGGAPAAPAGPAWP